MPNYRALNHVALATGDMEATVRFWRDLLGLRLVAGLGRPGGRQYFFELSPGSYVAFFEWEQVEPVEEKDHGYPVKGPFIFDHLALEVSGEDELWEVKDRLEAAGFWVSEPIDHGFIQSVYSFDPNGVPLEFCCPVEGMAQRLHQRPALLDRRPPAAAREGAEPRPGHWPRPRPTPPSERAVYPGEGLVLRQRGGDL